MMKLISLLAIASAMALSSCQWGQKAWENSSSNPKLKFGTYANPVDSDAKRINAKYAKEYNLSGNVIAQYPDFDIHLVSTVIKGEETTSLFEITSKNGIEKEQIRCTTKDPEKKHLYIADMHFFYHSEDPGKINIYIPPMLLASQYLPSNNTL